MGNVQSISKEDFNSIISGSKYSLDEIRDYYRTFIKQFPKGKISRLEFIHTYSKCFANYREAIEFTDHVFRVYDIDGDGFVTFSEFLISMGVASKGTARQKLEWAFKMYDIDESGEISYSEMIEVLTALYKAKGVTDPIRKAVVATKAIMKLDTDKNGSLSEDEFVNGALDSPSILALLQGK